MDGIALNCPIYASGTSDGLDDLRRRNIPVVVLHFRSPDPAIPAIRIDNEAGTYLATRHLLRLGHRHIAHVTGTIPDLPDDEVPAERPLAPTSLDRYRGYRRALRETGVAFEGSWLAQDRIATPAAGKQLVRALLARAGRRPTAIVCYNDQMAFGALRALHEMGLRVPGDMAVVGFDGLAFGSYITPTLTTVDFPRGTMGRSAVEALFAQFDGRRLDPVEQVLPVELIVRESCGATVALDARDEGRAVPRR